jgi:hypothetical protein
MQLAVIQELRNRKYAKRTNLSDQINFLELVLDGVTIVLPIHQHLDLGIDNQFQTSIGYFSLI